ncbi:RidA family protein [Mameliella sp. CS4]|uniref:RidA family protein n=1 Tax=Mameliella sp. CS4 TaxID=2862329 RepID=UPI001C5D60FB|nr:RidA family protein [Mameliella sp. CS4]MBW4983000.1 RidA family protein [Mameliella sp. CS4]
MFSFIKSSARVAAALSVLLSPGVAYAEGHMARDAINPVTWPAAIFNQGEVVTAPCRFLTIAGQASLQTDPDAPFGVSTLHPGDMRAQMTEVLSNIDAVLEGAGMTRDDLTELTVYVTDSGAALGNYDVLMGWLGDARSR